MAIVNRVDEVIFCRACPSENRAQRAIVSYLRENEDFDGKTFDEACFWIGEKDLRLDLMVFAMEPEDFRDVWDRLAMFRSDLPLEDKGLYRVIYEIDVGADSAIEAAKIVHKFMRDRDSLPPILDVIDSEDRRIRIDLSKGTKGTQRC